MTTAIPPSEMAFFEMDLADLDKAPPIPRTFTTELGLLPPPNLPFLSSGTLPPTFRLLAPLSPERSRQVAAQVVTRAAVSAIRIISHDEIFNMGFDLHAILPRLEPAATPARPFGKPRPFRKRLAHTSYKLAVIRGKLLPTIEE